MRTSSLFPALLGLLCLTTGASAQTLLVQSFTGTDGAVPADWVLRWRGAGTARVGAIATFSNNVSTNRQGFLIQRTAAGTSPSNSSANLFYTGSTPLSPTGSMSDFEGSIKLTIDGATSVNRGVLLRAQATTAYAPVNGYYLALTQNNLTLYHNPQDHTTPGTTLATDTFTASLGTEYVLSFHFDGTDFSASLSNGVTEVASLVVDLTDPEFAGLAYYSSGAFGLRTGYGSASSSYFYDLQIDAVPEPGSFVLLGVGALAFAALRRRSNKPVAA